LATRTFGAVALAIWALVALAKLDAWTSGAAVTACVVAVAIAARPIASRVPRLTLVAPSWAFAGACALAAAAISYAVVRVHLRSTPLSIDAATYLMEARALAHGRLGAPIEAPRLAFGGHFLFEGADGRMHGVFPPGYPLFLAAFALMRAPMLAGPATAALLSLAQYALGRAAGGREGELATRASLLLSLPSFARAIETADLLSHAFVGVLATAAIACALAYVERPSRARAAAIGACVAWAFASRLLDGAILAIAVVAIVARAKAKAPLALAIVAAIPFVALLAADQRAATGSFFTPTQSAYFARADWPPTCHRLGFGADVGCNVEHPDAVARDGPDGYGPDDALRVVRERASALGVDLFGFAPLALLAFVPLLRRTRAQGDAACAAFAIALTLGYGLFYYGNATAFGARHLFPAAPCFWLLVGRALAGAPHRASGWLDAAHARGAAVAAAIAVAAVTARSTWTSRGARVEEHQASRSDLRRIFARHAIDRGILESRDAIAVIAAYEGDRDRVAVQDDRSGLLDLRRARPELPLLLALEHDEVGRMYTPPPAPGLLVELERAWPSFQRPSGLGARALDDASASGGAVLDIAWSREGAEIAIPFDVTTGARYALRVSGIAGPDHGDYALAIDGEPLATWRGHALSPEARRTDAVERTLAQGRHTLTARCTGRAAESSGHRAMLDALIGDTP
jgi:hypothetical protein